VRVLRVTPDPAANECTAITRVEYPDGRHVKFLWRCSQAGTGDWLFYDYEALDGSIRGIHEVVGSRSLYAYVEHAPARWGPYVRDLDELRVALSKGDPTSALAAMIALHDTRFPEPLEATRLMLEGEYSLQKHAFDAAIRMFDQAEFLKVDSPRIHLLRARALVGVKQAVKAVGAAERYIEIVGDDGEGYAAMGAAEELRYLWPRAADAYRKGLAADPGNAECAKGLARATAEIGRGDTAPPAAETTEPTPTTRTR
jgi:hypothetical protein